MKYHEKPWIETKSIANILKPFRSQKECMLKDGRKIKARRDFCLETNQVVRLVDSKEVFNFYKSHILQKLSPMGLFISYFN